jgi:protein O-mannosyl-transferase
VTHDNFSNSLSSVTAKSIRRARRRAEAERLPLPRWLTEQRLLILLLAGLCAFVLVVYVRSIHSKFVYDSTEEIVAWDYIHDPRNILTPLTFRLMSMDVLDFNRPVSVAYLMFNSMLWGREPFGYHLTNILLHGAMTCLVFLLIRHILAQKSDPENPAWRNLAAFLAALVFAVHPVMTEAVCEPSYCKDLLAALFGLTALLVATRHGPGMGNGDALRLFLVPLLCLLAIGSKESGAAFPAILFLYWILFRRNEPGKFWAWTLVSSAAVVVLFLIARFALEHRPSEVFLDPPEYPDGSLGSALLIQPRILTLYLLNIVWPANLCADYNAYSIRSLGLAPSLFVLAAVAGLAGWWSVKDRRVLFGCGLIAFTLLPVCNLVPIYHPLADRYLYLPLTGIALLVAVAADSPWLAAKSVRRAAAVLGCLLVIGVLIPLTLKREKVWANELALWQDTLHRNPASFPARVNICEAFYTAGRYEEAKLASEATLQTPYATTPWVWFDYALELNRLGDRAGAGRAARRAIELQSDIADADKMVRTLQCPRNLADEFAQFVATLPKQKQQ